MISFKQDTKTINDKENLRGYRFGTVSGETICYLGFQPRSRAHHPHSFSSKQASAIFLGE
jgi:hypothetical protein